MFHNNILMFENIARHYKKFDKMFYFGSGACFGRNRNIDNFTDKDIYDFTQIENDYYGFSKNVIEKLIPNYPNIYNFRIFNCFGQYEKKTRFIKSCLNNYKNKKMIRIFEDRYFDFFYIKDLFTVIKYYIENNDILKKSINMVYKKKYKLSDIANIINKLSDNKVDVKIDKINLQNNYTGKYELQFIEKKLLGIENSIKDLNVFSLNHFRNHCI